MAKETMQAVSDAETAAHRTLLDARKECEQLLADAGERSRKLVADAEKEAAKRVNVLLGVAQADGEKLKAKAVEETGAEQERLRAAAEAAYPQAAKLLREIVSGTAEGR